LIEYAGLLQPTLACAAPPAEPSNQVPAAQLERANMPEPDFEGARRYVLDRLARELSPALRYHSLAHTRDDVTAATERLADMEGIGPADWLLLQTGAYFHDIGFVEQREEHEAASVRIVREILPGYGYDPQQVDVIADLVMATRLPQTPATHLQEILTDADLDVLGRTDYWARNDDLRAEWAAFGLVVRDEDWHRGQIEFLSAHRYFTASARRLREATKQANLARLHLLLNGAA
jgi:uncharacterized protein